MDYDPERKMFKLDQDEVRALGFNITYEWPETEANNLSELAIEARQRESHRDISQYPDYARRRSELEKQTQITTTLSRLIQQLQPFVFEASPRPQELGLVSEVENFLRQQNG